MSKYQQKYIVNNPWYKHYKYISRRCSKSGCYYKKGIKNLISTEDLKYLWFRDDAYLLKRPSIDRINPKGHYELSNCRFIEWSKNASRAILGIKRSKETKDKIKNKLKGRRLSPNTEFKSGYNPRRNNEGKNQYSKKD